MININLKIPTVNSLPESEKHFLLYIPWNEKYLEFVPDDYKKFFKEILPILNARTTDVHKAVCLQYLDEFIDKAKQNGEMPNRNVLAYALMLHDAGWSQMTQEEIAASLGVKGLALNTKAMGPKEKHAVLGAQIAKKILTNNKDKLGISNKEVEIICTAILYHDKPELVSGSQNQIPIEIKLLVDLDHIWSFTQLNFWQDVQRKGVDSKEYLENLKNDLNNYFVTNIGKDKARELLVQREIEVINENQ